MKNIPNALSFLRIILAPSSMLLIYFPGIQNSVFVTIISISAISDFLDGYLARKLNYQTKSGTVLDQIADKIFILCFIFAFTIVSLLPAWIFILFLIRDIAINGARLHINNSIKSLGRLNKLKTALMYASCLSVFLVPTWLYFLFLFALILSYLSIIPVFKTIIQNNDSL